MHFVSLLFQAKNKLNNANEGKKENEKQNGEK